MRYESCKTGSIAWCWSGYGGYGVSIESMQGNGEDGRWDRKHWGGGGLLVRARGGGWGVRGGWIRWEGDYL